MKSWLSGLRRAKPLRILAAGTWLVAALVLWHRLPYGVSHTDEAFYSAMPYSFLLGNKPYFTELAMHQNAALLLVPFFRVYLAVVGSADGIIMFNRHLYFAYICICSILAYRLVSRISGSVFACFVAALIIPFSYFALFALSYNTCGAFGFFCGIVSTATALLGPRPGRQLFGASLWFLSGIFAYPGYAPALLLYVLIVVFWLYRRAPREDLKSGLLGLGAGLVAFLAVIVPLAVWLGKAGVDRLIGFSQSMGYVSMGFLAKLNPTGTVAWLWRWGVLEFACAFVLLPVACRLLQRAAWALPLIALRAAWYLNLLSLRDTFGTGDVRAGFSRGVTVCLIALPVLTPVCILLNRQWRYGRFILTLVWLPAFVSMVCVVYSSANGYVSMPLGSLGTTLAGVVSFHALLMHLAERNPTQKRYFFQLTSACVVAPIIAMHFSNIYSGCYDIESALARHDTRVSAGPLKGALATRVEAARIEAIDRDLKSVQDQGASLSVFDNFATGYLSTRLQPRTFSQWIVWDIAPAYAQLLTEQTFGAPDKLPDFVLELDVVDGARQFWEPYFKGKYSPVIRRPKLGYVIMKRNKPRRRHAK
ncbi:MAG TPA: hypothetical protein VHW01_17260 [Polyangiaceae bacterium]|nr:hypothetical protein [Polyangiaceae bacterium]